MSILIKGMEMPKRGESCLIITITPDGEVYKNVYDASFRVNQLGEAIPLPPHADLIERKAVLNTFSTHMNRTMHYIIIRDTVPTIISAEEEKHETNL